MGITTRLAFAIAPKFLVRSIEGCHRNPVVRAEATIAQRSITIPDLAKAIIRDCFTTEWTLNREAIEVYNDHFWQFPLSRFEEKRLKDELKNELILWGNNQPIFSLTKLMNQVSIKASDFIM